MAQKTKDTSNGSNGSSTSKERGLEVIRKQFFNILDKLTPEEKVKFVGMEGVIDTMANTKEFSFLMYNYQALCECYPHHAEKVDGSDTDGEMDAGGANGDEKDGGDRRHLSSFNVNKMILHLPNGQTSLGNGKYYGSRGNTPIRKLTANDGYPSEVVAVFNHERRGMKKLSIYKVKDNIYYIKPTPHERNTAVKTFLVICD